MEAQPSNDHSQVDMMSNVGAAAIAVCQRGGFGFDAFVNLMCAYRFAKDSYEMGWPLDFGTVCRIGGQVAGLSADMPLAVLFRDGPVRDEGACGRPVHGHVERLECLICDLREGMEPDAFIWKFRRVAPFRLGNNRTAWILQNWLDDTMEDPDLPRQLG